MSHDAPAPDQVMYTPPPYGRVEPHRATTDRWRRAGIGALETPELLDVLGIHADAETLATLGGLRGLLDPPASQLAEPERLRAEAALELSARWLEETVRRCGNPLTSPAHTSRFLCARLRSRPYEVFAALFLDNRHRVISFEEMFRGTVDGSSVYPREVAKRALELNSAAIVAAHNHPSGLAEPSRSDQAITKKLAEALALIDVRLLDHFVIGDGEVCSFAERGWL